MRVLGAQAVPFINHAQANPPIDRNKAADLVKDVYVSIQREPTPGFLCPAPAVTSSGSSRTRSDSASGCGHQNTGAKRF
jgi:hypothetical protein